MSWRACFLDGPLAGADHDRMFAAPQVADRLWLAQVPDEGGRLGPGVWSVVGSLPGGGEPWEVWPEQVEYVRDPDLSDAGAGFAVFRLAHPDVDPADV